MCKYSPPLFLTKQDLLVLSAFFSLSLYKIFSKESHRKQMEIIPNVLLARAGKKNSSNKQEFSSGKSMDFPHQVFWSSAFYLRAAFPACLPC